MDKGRQKTDISTCDLIYEFATKNTVFNGTINAISLGILSSLRSCQ